MPCGDGGYSYDQERERDGIIASWCAILTVLEEYDKLDDTLNRVDWEEAGITKEEVLGWWAAHKRKDAERRKREKEARDLKALQKRALAKLTPEEKAALKNRW